MTETELMATPEACRLAGVSYRQATYYRRTGLVTPSWREGPGPGYPCGWSRTDVLLLCLVGKLMSMGCERGTVMPAASRMAAEDYSGWDGLLMVTPDGMVLRCASVSGGDGWVVDLGCIRAEVYRRSQEHSAVSA